MLDIQFIRDNPELVEEKAKQKGYEVDVNALLKVDEERRHLLVELEALRAARNDHAASLRQGKPSAEAIEKGKELKEQATLLEQKLAPLEQDVITLLKAIPNMPLDTVPVGSSEDENVVSKVVGEPTKFAFTPKNHAQIAEAKGWLDKERAAKVAGSRFAYLKGDLVLLDWAMNMFALTKLTDQSFVAGLIKDAGLSLSDKPFVPVQPPAVAKTDVYDATGRLNKEEQTYKLAEDDLWLNASAEHVLAPMYLDEILPEDALPIRYVGYTTAFRREAGTYGKDMEGFLRLHQFNKLEMESFNTPDTSLEEHKLMVAIQEYFMAALKLPYRVVDKCTADIGGPNASGIDIDVWLPGQNKYRETHTADLMTDYQTRRMQTKLRRKDGSLVFAHTNDATALSQRPLIAIIENYQTEEGDVIVPEVLRPFMGGKERI
ncbi:serine--tRNA ligase [Candidatus Saccharibacteria bacterium]|nr:MAG: serine--tRNA ligase [Candidatus Saccharibacteria bacterium]